jgi:Kef-type K+ transport system membrane component KefB/mannitol/fructose-specific phosphotransferase system IIA component (Ntr-type)
MSMSASEITLFLVGLSIILLFARGFGELLRLAKQPIVIGEIIAGIVLGPTIFGYIFPGAFNKLFVESESISIALHAITLLGIVMLLLVSGIEIDLSLLIRQSKKALLISILGVAFPFALGFTFAYLFPHKFDIVNYEDRLIYALFIGTALSITALPVVARTLMDLNIFKSEIGFSIITSAMFNDLVGWIIFSIILGMLGTNIGHGMSVENLVLMLFAFIIVSLLFLRKIIDYMLSFAKKYMSNPGGILNIIFIIGFSAAAFTEYIGIHAIFGAFIIGIAIGDSVHLTEDVREIINQFVTNIFAPLFFVSIGLRINFIQNFDPALVIILLVLSVVGKVFGSTLGAKLGGFNKYDSWTIGFGLNTHGTIELVLGTVAYEAGLINERVFVALIIMALTTTLTSAPLMSYFIKKSRSRFSFAGILKKEAVFIADDSVSDKKELIRKLSAKVAEVHGLNKDLIFDEVWKREETISTGLENHLALPHARCDVKNPVAALAVHKKGIDFDSIDGKPSRLIILLITPKDKPELQLELLSAIARKLGKSDIIDYITGLNSKEEIIKTINRLFAS